MSQFRTVKINNILNSSDRIQNLKNQTLYSSGIDSITKKNNNLYYNTTFTLNCCNCLATAQSYDMLLSLMKGHNLCNICPCPDTDVLNGQINEANIMRVTTTDMSLCLPSRSIYQDLSWNTIDLSLDEVLIDPSNLFVNKQSCSPYIYNLNPIDNRPIYLLDISQNTTEYYKRIHKTNNSRQLLQILN